MSDLNPFKYKSMNLRRGGNAVRRQNRIGWAAILLAAALLLVYGKMLWRCVRF